MADVPSIEGIIIFLPSEFAFESGFERIRHYLDTHLGLAGVLEFPAETFGPGDPPRSLIALGNYPVRSTRQTAFLSLSARGDLVNYKNQQWLSDFRSGLLGEKMDIGWLSDTPDNAGSGEGSRSGAAPSNWTPHMNRPDTRAIEQRIRKLAYTLPLGQLYDIHQGARIHIDEARSDRGVPVVRGRDLSSRQLTGDDLPKVQLTSMVPDVLKVRAGDILLQRRGPKPKAVIATPAWS